jgi:hypothetical protein
LSYSISPRVWFCNKCLIWLLRSGTLKIQVRNTLAWRRKSAKVPWRRKRRERRGRTSLDRGNTWSCSPRAARRGT